MAMNLKLCTKLYMVQSRQLHVISQSTAVLCIQVNKKSCRLRMAAYRDGVKKKGDKIGMGV